MQRRSLVVKSYNIMREVNRGGLENQGFQEDADRLGVEGRIVAVREHKKTMFCDVYNGLTRTQIVFEDLGDDEPPDIKVGDFVQCVGNFGATNSGQTSLFVEGFRLLARPENYEREDLNLRELLVSRAKAKEIIRSGFLQYGLIEVDSRVMSPYAGTANIVPFSTRSTRGDDFYLRFTMELELKKYLCRTQLPVFEIGKLFRNLGTSSRRETEFTAAEAYIPYMNLEEGVDLVSDILQKIGQQFLTDFSNIQQREILELLGPRTAEGTGFLGLEQRERDNKEVKRMNEPTFLLHQPADWASPFTKTNPDGTACDAKFVYAGAGTIVHLNEESGDYRRVLSRLLSQFEIVKRERPEAQLDIGFLEEFKKGLPPCLGIFIGFDRLMMTLLGKGSIKEVMPEKVVL
jgi:lysyl-tRNA synthetase, class II